MEKVLDWVNKKFQNPLSPLFFLVGGLLILLGVSKGLNIPIFSEIAPEENFRWISLIIGLIFSVFAVIVYYRPARIKEIGPVQDSSEKRDEDHKNQIRLGSVGEEDVESIPIELRLNFSQRRAILSETQESILRFLIKEGNIGQGIFETKVRSKFSHIGKTELFYRLEHLHLLNFIDKEKLGQDDSGADIFSYRLSRSFYNEIGEPNTISSLTYLQNISPATPGVDIKPDSHESHLPKDIGKDK